MGRRRRVTPECKRQAIELLNAGQRPAAEIARELGIPQNRLSKGQKAMGVHGGAFPGWGRQAEPAAEVTRLRRELARVTEEEQDILKSRRILCEGVHVQDAFMQWVLCVAGSASACPRPGGSTATPASPPASSGDAGNVWGRPTLAGGSMSGPSVWGGIGSSDSASGGGWKPGESDASG